MYLSTVDRVSAAGFRHARVITKKYAKTFYFASRFLPENKRYACYAVYALCRASDDAVDSSRGSRQQAALSAMKIKLDAAFGSGALQDSSLAAFQLVLKEYGIPRAYFDDLLAGMRMDLDKTRYDTFDELHTYCYRVAGVIGLIMLKIFGTDNHLTGNFAVDLGVALQLTNIARDVKEDYARGRIYLPLAELRQFGVTEEQIARGTADENFRALIQYQIRRARGYYTTADTGIRLLTDRRARLVVLAISRVYEAILDEIERARCDVFSRRAYVNGVKKFFIALRIACSGAYL